MRKKPYTREEKDRNNGLQRRRRAAMSETEKISQRDQSRVRVKAWRKLPENREKERIWSKAWRDKNLERSRAARREVMRKYHVDGVPKMYFIQAASGPVKIGFTQKQVRGRLQELQVGNHEELTVLAVVETQGRHRNGGGSGEHWHRDRGHRGGCVVPAGRGGEEPLLRLVKTTPCAAMHASEEWCSYCLPAGTEPPKESA